MNIIVIGMGQVGRHIAEVLVTEQHDVTLIDTDIDALSYAEENMDVMTLKGHGGSVQTLIEAKVGEADLLIAVTSSDEVNLLASLLAKRMGARRVVARVSDPENQPREGEDLAGILGIDLTISPELLAASEIKRLIDSRSALWVEELADGQVTLMQLPVHDPEESTLGSTLAELNLPAGCLVAAIARSEDFIIPHGQEIIMDGDEVFLIGQSDVVASARRYFVSGSESATGKVVIIGGSDIGFYLARQLAAADIDTVIVEQNRDRCRELSEQLENVVVLNGDGTQKALLREEGLDSADVFVSATKSDEINLMAGLLARKMGVPRTIALVHKPDYAPVYKQLGIDTTISPRLMAASQVLRYVRAGKIISVTVLAGGRGEAIELEVQRGSRIENVPLKNADFPRGAVIGAVATSKGVIIPRGDDVIPAGARVVVFTTRDVRRQVERVFRK